MNYFHLDVSYLFVTTFASDIIKEIASRPNIQAQARVIGKKYILLFIIWTTNEALFI